MDSTDQPAGPEGGSPPERPGHEKLYRKAWAVLRTVLVVTSMVAEGRHDGGPAFAARALVIIGDCAVTLARESNRTVR